MNSSKELVLVEYAAEVMVYFERHKILDIVSRVIAEIGLLRPSDPQQWIATNICRIADEFYKKCLEASFRKINYENKLFQLPRRFHYRVMIHGRLGSGRKSQAIALVKRFNLIYIDADQLIYAHLYGKDSLDKDLQMAFVEDAPNKKSVALGKILQKRILQTDALRNGWVLVNYPRSLADFRQLFEHFQIPPNKLVYLQCSEKLALRRLVEKPNLGCPQDNVKYMKYEMSYFENTEAEIKEYLRRRHETIFVDSEPCFEAVRTSLWSQLSRVPYVLGFKN